MPTLVQALALILKYKYAIMLPLAIVEGPILTVICGFLFHQGYIAFLPTYLTLMAGDLIGDAAWYLIGRFWARPFIKNYGHKFGLTPARFSAVGVMFKKHQKKTLLISKMSSGFGLAVVVLMTAGSIGITFPVFMVLNAIGQLIWSGMLMTLGYFFGQSYELIDQSMRSAYLVVGIVIFVVGLYSVQRHLRKGVTAKPTV